jgi:hypothetical protein
MKTRKLLALALSIGALTSPRPAPGMAQRTGDFEIEVDAPWRMEPHDGGYGAIPIQVSIHDADQPRTPLDNELQQLINLNQEGWSLANVLYAYFGRFIASVLEGPLDEALQLLLNTEVIPLDEFPHVTKLERFHSLAVYEETNGVFTLSRTFTLTDIHEVERTIGLWQYDPAQDGPESPHTPPPRPSHALCRRWQGQDCSGFAALRPTSEWNLTAMYTPMNPAVGRDLRLRVDLKVDTIEGGDVSSETYSRFLLVHLGEQPLPKFDASWAYGDLHYHSQGTDNDGESGYSYRGTLQAMSAMGLDFAFATDHASNSPQIGSASPIPTFELVLPIMRGARDLTPDRFAFGIDLLNGPSGGNREVTSHARSLGVGQLAAPQLFLGSEVDVTPEADEVQGYGLQACKDLPLAFKIIDQKTVPPFIDDYWCDGMNDPQPDGRFLAFDVQGPAGGEFLSTKFYGRQHLLHLPVDGQRRDAFIPSNTSKYGGATRRLGAILDVELAQRQKGFIFLAHPFDRADGAEMSRMGPDLVPYSDVQLEDAFNSEHVIGLQIWNENPLRSAKANDLHPFRPPFWHEQHQPSHAYAFQQWDIQQLYGLDEARTKDLSWLDPGTHAARRLPRRVFAAAGSDAHGDWNYRREGYFLGTSDVADTALGNPRNLVQVGDPQGSTIASAAGTGRPLSQRQVVDGLRSGNFTLTDGPAVRVMIDANEDGTIDPGDVPMGGQYEHPSSDPFQVIVEWKSSPEFGKVESVDLLLGVWADGLMEDGIVYTRAYDLASAPAPVNVSNFANTFIEPATGKTFVRAPNHPYWYDPNATFDSGTGSRVEVNPLHYEPDPGSEGYGGKRVFAIDPNRYPMGYGECIHADVQMASSGTTSSSSVGATTVTSTATGDTTGGGTTTNGDGEVVYLDQSLKDKLKDLENGIDIPPPGCIRRDFAKAQRPDRMFIRAEVTNSGAPVYRRAYTNPVWVNLPHCGKTNVRCLEANVAAVNGTLQVADSGSTPTSITTGVTPQGTLTTTTTTSGTSTTSGTLSADQLAALLAKLGSTTTTGTTSGTTSLSTLKSTTTSTTTSTQLGTTTLRAR